MARTKAVASLAQFSQAAHSLSSATFAGGAAALRFFFFFAAPLAVARSATTQTLRSDGRGATLRGSAMLSKWQ